VFTFEYEVNIVAAIERTRVSGMKEAQLQLGEERRGEERTSRGRRAGRDQDPNGSNEALRV